MTTATARTSAVPEESASEHLRNALAILRARLEQGAAAGELALDLGAVVARLERAVAALDAGRASVPSANLAVARHPVRATVELTWATSCAWLAAAWRLGDQPTAAELLAHWQTCRRCQADAADARARVARCSWVSGNGDGT